VLPRVKTWQNEGCGVKNHEPVSPAAAYLAMDEAVV
jgi:hypothetical protein